MLGIITIAEKPREPRIYTLEEYLRREERAVPEAEFLDMGRRSKARLDPLAPADGRNEEKNKETESCRV